MFKQIKKVLKISVFLFFATSFLRAQVLDASFTSANPGQCTGNLFTLNANTTTYSSYSWSISGPGFSQTPSGSSVAVVLTTVGTYDVTLTVTNGANSNSNTVNAYLQVYDDPTITYTVTPQVGCIPLSVDFDGSCTPGSGSLQSFQISSGDGQSYNTEDATHLYENAGTYIPSVTVTNSFGCFSSQTLPSITVNTPAVLSSTLSPSSICSGDLFSYNPTSTTAGCTFTWIRQNNANIAEAPTSGTGSINENLTNTSAANTQVTYEVTTTTPEGCITVENVVVTVNATPTVSISPNPIAICTGTPATATANGLPSGGSYSWDNGLGTSASVSLGSAGTYSVFYTLNGCTSATESVVVTENTPPTVSISAVESSGIANNDGVICPGSNVVLTANPSIAGGTYAWSTSAATQSINVSPAATTIYTVTYTDNSTSCTASSSFTVTVESAPTNSYSSSVTNACSAPATTTYNSTSTIGGGNTISTTTWSFPGGFPNSGTGPGPLSVTYTSSGVYGITITTVGSNGCTSTNNYNTAVVVDNGPAPSSSFNTVPSTTQCINEAFTFIYTGIGGDSIEWNFGDGTTAWTNSFNSASHSYAQVGTYTVTMTPWTVVAGNLGCSGNPSTVIVDVLGPKASFSITGFDCSNQISSRTFTSTSTGTTASTVYSWDFGDGSPVNNNQVVNHTFLSYGTFVVTLTVSDPFNGCPPSTQSATIRVIPNDQADFQAYLNSVVTTEVCLGTILTFENETPNPQYNSGSFPASASSNKTLWDWDISNGITFTTSSPLLRGTPRTRGFTTANGYYPGTFGIAMVNRDVNNCYDTIVKPDYITVHGIIGDFVAPNAACLGQTISFTDTSTAPMSSIVSRTWQWGDGSPDLLGNVANPTHSYSTPGIYTVTLLVEDAFGCTQSFSHTVDIRNPQAAFSLTENFICNNQSIDVADLSVGTNITSWNWVATNSTPPNSSDPNFGTFVFTSEGSQDITLTIEDDAGCVDDTTMTISVFDPILSVTADQNSFSCFNPPNLVQFTNNSTNNIDSSTVLWNFDNGQSSTSWNASTTYSNVGTYYVTLTLSSNSGCTITDTVSVITVDGPTGSIAVDNANLTGCSCYNASITVTTSNVDEASVLFGDGAFVDLVPNTTQTVNYSYCVS